MHTQIAASKTKWNEIKVEAMIDDELVEQNEKEGQLALCFALFQTAA